MCNKNPRPLKAGTEFSHPNLLWIWRGIQTGGQEIHDHVGGLHGEHAVGFQKTKNLNAEVSESVKIMHTKVKGREGVKKGTGSERQQGFWL